MGSQLTKNYDVEKEAFIQGGLHGQWRVHRAKKKTGTDLADVAIFMYDKKNAKVTKQLTAAQQLEIFEILKRDATGLAKFRHPNMLNLIEAPIEDKTIIAYVTEPFEFNLASIAADPSKKELIPSELDLKCILLELIEIVNFLHANTKSIHLNLAPEHVYITKDGKMKLAGLNFIKNFTSADAVPAQLDSLLRVGDVSLVPNLRFAAPEVSSQAGMVSAQADIFSIGCLIYYMVQLNQGRDPYIISMSDCTSQTQHRTECGNLDQKLSKLLSPLDANLLFIIKNMMATDPQMRGSLNQYVQNAWFQDPLLKTIRYLENIHYKEPAQKLQFLTSITKVLDRFDKRTLVKKVIPLLIDALKDSKLSALVLSNVFYILSKDMLTTTEFRAVVWPAICTLTKSKELPAQSIFYLVKNSETLLKFAPQQEFISNFLPLLQKSLECGVPKLQLLALDQIQQMFKKLDYQTFKSFLLPRVMNILENQTDVLAKIKVLEFLKAMQDKIDQDTMQSLVFKVFEKIRVKETDPQICMLILQIYEKAASALGADIIGVKILPSIIPLMVTGNVSRTQFSEMMKAVRSLLDKIEVSRLQSLPETSTSALDTPVVDPKSKELNDELGFLNQPIGGVSSATGANKDPFSGNLEDLFAGMGMGNSTPNSVAPTRSASFGGAPVVRPQTTFTQSSQPLTTIQANKEQQIKPLGAPQTMHSPAPQQQKTATFQFATPVQPQPQQDLFGFSSSKQTNNSDPFASMFQNEPVKQQSAANTNLTGWGDNIFDAQITKPTQSQAPADPWAQMGLPTQQQQQTTKTIADPFASLIGNSSQPSTQKQQSNDPFAGLGF